MVRASVLDEIADENGPRGREGPIILSWTYVLDMAPSRTSNFSNAIVGPF
jgi:hypothetical protein